MRAAALPASPRLAAVVHWMPRLQSPLVVLALAMTALLAAVPPLGEFPINDDWLYARTVQGLVERGQLEVPAWGASSLVLQAYWGALFARLFGFSHIALRISTVVLGAAGVLGCYALLRELLDARRALLGALLLLVNPLYITLSYSFMTDVPFLSLTLWALFCYVRALRGQRPHLGWLAGGSAAAGGAFLVRQFGAALPLAALGGLLLTGGWRAALQPRRLAAVLAPVLPAVLLAAYFDGQRGGVREDSLGWTFAFWMSHGPGLVGVVLDRFAATFCTLGLFGLPLSLGAVAGRPALELGQRRRWLAGALLLALPAGILLHSVTFWQPPLFPYTKNVLSPRGFLGLDQYTETLPQSIVLPGGVLVALTAVAIIGGALLLVAVAALPSRTVRTPAAVPLLFGLFALGMVLLYRQFFDRYLLGLLPIALLVTLPALREVRWSRALALAGVALLAAWSIWWEREFLERRSALWQAGRLLVEQGVPPEEINGGFEWNGWFRGQAFIAAGVQQARVDGGGRQLERYVMERLHMRKARYSLEYAPSEEAASGSVLAVVPYGGGHQVLAVQHP